MTRTELLASLIGSPWHWKGGNCWDFAAFIQRELFDRGLPHVDVPDAPSWEWILNAVGSHPENANWQLQPEGPHGLIAAADGAMCLMARSKGPGHVGVWLKAERAVIHCDAPHGVCLESPAALKHKGWRRLFFYEAKIACPLA